VDGKANAAIIAFIAERLGLAKNAVTVERGGSSRRKLVRAGVAGRAPDVLLD